MRHGVRALGSAGACLAGCCVVVAVVAALGIGLRSSGMDVAWPLLALIGIVACGLVIVAISRRWPEPVSPHWTISVDRPTAPRDRDRRAERLADQCRGASPAERFTTTQLRETLRTIAAQRLVRRHGADPDHPFAGATGLLSPALLAYLTETGDAPAVRRTTLAAHLKEIDAL